jgi:rhodanese-related sulfurtransferase
MTPITPQQARQLLDRGAVLIDIREADEHARQRIADAVNVPLSKLDRSVAPLDRQTSVIFHCKSGARTLGNAGRLDEFAEGCDAYLVEGGIDAWRNAGLPIVDDRRQPLELQRQVQIAAGSLAAIGAALALLASPWFAALPLFIGCGLVFAGVSGTCGLAEVLKRAPWNRSVFAGRPSTSSS